MKVLSIILLFILFSRAVNVNDVGTIILRAGANWVSQSANQNAQVANSISSKANSVSSTFNGVASDINQQLSQINILAYTANKISNVANIVSQTTSSPVIANTANGVSSMSNQAAAQLEGYSILGQAAVAGSNVVSGSSIIVSKVANEVASQNNAVESLFDPHASQENQIIAKAVQNQTQFNIQQTQQNQDQLNQNIKQGIINGAITAQNIYTTSQNTIGTVANIVTQNSEKIYNANSENPMIQQAALGTAIVSNTIANFANQQAQNQIQQTSQFISEVSSSSIEKNYPSYASNFTQQLIDLFLSNQSGTLNQTDSYKSIEFIAQKNGFQIESHKVLTPDGYILKIWRIPGLLSEIGQTLNNKPPVLLQHGLGSDMMQWVMHRPEEAHAFVLARNGYDVWLGNNRGTRFSQTHQTLNPNSKDYWNFDWEDMGTADTPSVIDFILNLTGFQKISYVGHSEGTTQIMAGASLMPEYYQSKILICIFLAPPASLKNNQVEFFKFLSQKENRKLFENQLDLLKQWNFLPYNFQMSQYSTLLCQMLDGDICNSFVQMFADSDPEMNYNERMEVYLSFTPSGGSYRNVLHYSQLVNQQEETFQRYDYGSDQKNNAIYGQPSPPQYNLSLLNFPIALFAGIQDQMVNVLDVYWTYKQLSSSVIYYQEYQLGHFSFAIARNMDWFKYDVLSILNDYNQICNQNIFDQSQYTPLICNQSSQSNQDNSSQNIDQNLQGEQENQQQNSETNFLQP